MPYQEPMRYWPALAPYAKDVVLIESGLRLHTYDAGPQDAPALLLVHGLGDESDSWRHIIQPLAKHQRVIAPDLPGFGRSASLQRYTIPALIRVLLDLLDTLKIAKAIFIGSSLGGMLSHATAIYHPNRVRGLVLIDGLLVTAKPQINLGTLLFMVPGIGEWTYSHYRKNPQAAYASLNPFYASLETLPAADREFLYQRVNERVWSNRQRRAYLAVLRNTATWMARQQRNLSENVKQLTVPTLIIFGELDQIMPLESARILSTLQATTRLITLPGVGHLPQQEAPEVLLLSMQNDSRLLIQL
jgi:pimeloyl-ACP methyl ester carboxylesterase